MAGNDFKFSVDLNVINHLGIGLYSSTAAALTELVANAWDADAKKVTVTVVEKTRTMTIEDNGHGMNAEGVQNKFLNVGYARRMKSRKPAWSESGKRRVMGRKGIGKLAMFALADEIIVSSQAKGQPPVGFRIDVPEFKKSLQTSTSVALTEHAPKPFPEGHGTRIELRKILPGLQTDENQLRARLARRFSVIEDANGFDVELNKKRITKQDRGFYESVQMLWGFDTKSKTDTAKLSPNIATLPRRDGKAGPVRKCLGTVAPAVKVGDETFKVTGYIASVSRPSQLGTRQDSANVLSVFANGRVFTENILGEINTAKHWQNYLVGEIHADFLDDDLIDRATASREAIKRDDPRYQALLQCAKTAIMKVGSEWDAWRVELGLDKADPQNQTVLDWIDTLQDPRDKKSASKLMTSIQNAILYAEEEKNAEAKRTLYRGAIVGFEKLRMARQLDKLETLTDVLGPEFAGLFATLGEVEEAAYADITRQRLAIIDKFADITDDPTTLEKVAQEYLFDNLWLLDPSWDRVTGRASMEVTIRSHLKKLKDLTGARLDITYRASSGRHVIVELKKPVMPVKFMALYEQADRYRKAVEAFYVEKQPGKPVPPIDVYLVVGATPSEFDERNRRSLAEINAQIVTYTELITDAKNAYQDYIIVKAHVGKLEALLTQL